MRAPGEAPEVLRERIEELEMALRGLHQAVRDQRQVKEALEVAGKVLDHRVTY